jgi:hypothetical protein
MKLKGLTSTVRLSALAADGELAQDVQTELARLGILDPPADGDFGPVSVLGWNTFLALEEGSAKNSSDADLTPQRAQLLLNADPAKLLPVKAGSDLAGAIWKALQARGDWLNRVPGFVNIVYIEGANLDGTPNSNSPNQFNDLRLVLTVAGGVPTIVGRWDGTTEPGKFYTENPINTAGAARIAFGQYKAWCVGLHDQGKPGEHEALVQRGVISVYRDANKDYLRDGDKLDTGSTFCINQHWGYDMSPTNVANASAGCLVGRTRVGHRAFMALVKKDSRYLASNAYKFMTSVVPAQALKPFLKVP